MLFRNFMLFFVCIYNTIKLGLYKSFFRKILSQLSFDKTSLEAKNYYLNNAKNTNQILNDIGFLNVGFEIPSNDVTKKSNAKSARSKMGGMTATSFVHSCVYNIKPSYSLECGVSRGGSTFSILSALDKIKHGHLFSSDLPYLWKTNPVANIGILVPDSLRHRWTLVLGDDRDTIPNLLSSYDHKYTFVHYDSDKRYISRKIFWENISPYLDSKYFIIFDDIMDNDHFYHLQKNYDPVNIHVLKHENKFLGVISKLS